MIPFCTLNRIAQCRKTSQENQRKYRKVSIQERWKYVFLRQEFKKKAREKGDLAKERGIEKWKEGLKEGKEREPGRKEERNSHGYSTPIVKLVLNTIFFQSMISNLWTEPVWVHSIVLYKASVEEFQQWVFPLSMI